MNNFVHLFHYEGVAHASTVAAAAFLAALWQGIGLAVLVALALKFLPRTTATARFVLWSVVFAASAALPLLHIAASTQSVEQPSPGSVLLDARWSYLLGALWLGATLYRLAMLTAEVVGICKLWRTAEPVALSVSQRAGLESVSGSRGSVEVCTTTEVDRPSVIGFFAPRILIPNWLFAELSETELHHILLHEMEHLRRRDDWLNLLQKLGLALFPLNPVMFWIDRQLSTEREIACDDGVLARTHAPRAYASSLTSIAERRFAFRRRVVALALGAFGTGTLLRRRSEFASRIESILGRRRPGSPALAAFLVVAVLAGTFALASAPELVFFSSPTASPALAETAPLKLPAIAEPASLRATFQNANFRVSSPEPAPRVRRRSSATARRAFPAISAASSANLPRQIPDGVIPTGAKHPQPRQWMLLTSADQQPTRSVGEDLSAKDRRAVQEDGDFVIPVARVLVRTSDGRFFVAPYAAVPTQAGWLIVQL